MANPSLQIGNSNWAIKEDDLLGYSTVGTNYLPKPMTMTRASAGTRVNPQGLVNYAEVLGGELLSQPVDLVTDFIVNSGGVIVDADTFDTFGGTYDGIRKNSCFTVGKKYKLTIQGDTTSSGFTIGDTSGSGNQYGSGFGTFYFTALGNGSLWIRQQTSGTTNITSFSVKEATIDNLARVDYTDGTSSLLVEPMRTNLINYSEDLSQWTIVNGTLTPNATVSPDGTQNAGKVAFNNTGLDLKKTITVVAGQTYTISFYIKLESGTGLDGRFYDNNNSANIEVYDYTSQIQGTEWSKITRSVTAPIGCTQMQIWLLASSSSLVTASFWGAQFELGSYPTSYIPTDGGTVTRVQDQYSKTGISNLINSEEGVLFVEMAALSDDLTNRRITISDGVGGNDVGFRFNNSSNTIQVVSYINSSVIVNESYVLSDITVIKKYALKWALNNYALWVDGVEVITDISAISFPADTLNTLNFGSATGSNPFFGKVKQLQVYKTALTDSELKTLTT